MFETRFFCINNWKENRLAVFENPFDAVTIHLLHSKNKNNSDSFLSGLITYLGQKWISILLCFLADRNENDVEDANEDNDEDDIDEDNDDADDS